MDERPEALLKSALEKIVYFEARSEQLSNDLETSRHELDKLRADLASAAQREIDLRRLVAELEVRAARAHSEREEAARVAEALRRERADLIGKMLQASRIHGADEVRTAEELDLARFISELRGEVLKGRGQRIAPTPDPAPQAPAEPPAAQAPAEPPTAHAPAESPAPAAQVSEVVELARELQREGRLAVSEENLGALALGHAFQGRTEETLFGFSVRELAAPDTQARVRAAERLKALGHPAAAPALAAALHGETEPDALVALLVSFASFAKAEGVPVVLPHLTSPHPDVRIASLKALLVLDAARAGPHLAAAVKDPDKAVRRRASLLALSLTGSAALDLGQQAVRDTDAEVRALAALVLGASGAEDARPLLFEALKDRDARVRRSAAQSVSRLLGTDVSHVVDLEDAQRRREVRRLATLPVRAVEVQALRAALDARLQPQAPRAAVAADAPPTFVAEPAPAPVAPRAEAPVASRAAAPVAPRAAALQAAAAKPQAKVAVLEVAASPKLVTDVLVELRTSIRGRTLGDLAANVSATVDETLAACNALEAQGSVVRRGMKYFVA